MVYIIQTLVYVIQTLVYINQTLVYSLSLMKCTFSPSSLLLSGEGEKVERKEARPLKKALQKKKTDGEK
ncbi:MAG: hypothetical protein D8B56_02260 [Alloprevotella sp.]|nr:MAG: hypothetical protein D8B56_02260 [Alloprevotella sp.]